MRRAARNGTGIERVYDVSGGFTEIRRAVVGGRSIPDHWIVDDSLVESEVSFTLPAVSERVAATRDAARSREQDRAQGGRTRARRAGRQT